MTRKMIINAIDPEEIRIAVIDDGKLQEFDIETRGTEKNKGNIYKARIIDVEPSLNAAFVDYGADKQGFLTAGDVDPRLAPKPVQGRHATIDQLLRNGQEVLVQVIKDEVGAKGAVLTTYLSLAGRYVVLTPESDHQSISRKIDDDDQREQLVDLIKELNIPQGMGMILRTAGRDRPVQDLSRDLDVLMHLWGNIKKEADTARAPALIFKEEDVIIRALRDYYTTDIDEVILDSDEAYDRAAEYMHLVMPRQRSVLTRYVERRPIFHHYRIEDQLDALYTPQVPLPAGGSIVIESTEAMVTIDVNSGKQKAGGHEETALQTNLEAAQEVARQLRLRDLGGIIVIDFIDMGQRKNHAKVEKALRDAVANDKARVKMGHISRNGTLELTRQRIRTALAASVFRKCSVCHGTGRILNPASHAAAILRRLQDRASRGDLAAATVRVEPAAANILRTEKWHALQDLEHAYGIRVDVGVERAFLPGQEDFTFETDSSKQAIDPAEPNFGPVEVPDELRAEMDAAAREEAEGRKAREDAALKDRAVARHQREREGRPERDRRPRPEGRRRAQADAGLPSFELVDLRDLGIAPNPKPARRPMASPQEQAPLQDGEHRGRRRRRRRRPSDEAAGLPPAMAAATPAPEAPPKKRGFFAWLFGMD